MTGIFAVSVIAASTLTGALELPWLVFVGYVVVATAAVTGYYRLTR